MSRHKTRIKFLTNDEVQLVIDRAGDYRTKALIETLFSTGLRISECVNLHRESLTGAEGPTKELSIVGKGGWQRVVFFSPKAQIALKAYQDARKDTDPRLFPITKRTAERAIKQAAKNANLVATPHTFRHSLATYLLKQGANIRIVQEMLGHRALSSTMVYTGVANKDLLEAHRKLIV